MGLTVVFPFHNGENWYPCAFRASGWSRLFGWPWPFGGCLFRPSVLLRPSVPRRSSGRPLRFLWFASENPVRPRKGPLGNVGGDPVNNTDPTGLWGAKKHKNFTKLAIDALVGDSNVKFNHLKAARKNLPKGSVNPDKVLKGVRKWHGHEGMEKLKKKQLVKAKRLWRQKNYKDAYFLIGKVLHSIQDFYAHNVFHNGSYLDSRHEEYRFAHGKISIDGNGNITWGASGDWLDSAFLEACKKNYQLNKGDKIHSFTADNVNADFVKVNGKYKWVWIDDKKANPRYINAIDKTLAYLKKFVVWAGKKKR